MRRVVVLTNYEYINTGFSHIIITASASHPSESLQHNTIASFLSILLYIIKMRFSTFIPALLVPLGP
jgi:hypothetical protein